MGESVSNLCHLPLLSLMLHLLVCILLPACTVSYDLSSLLAALGGNKGPPQCPMYCNCSSRRAEETMQDYLTQYLPGMGQHMQPDLPRQARATVTIFTSWIGSMADIQCHLPENERVNLTDLLQSSSLSFKSLQLTCGQNASVVWDISAFDAFLSILNVSGCNLEKAESSDALVVPINLWILDLSDIPPEAAQNLDISSAQGLLVLSITNSNLTSLPDHWSNIILFRLMLIRLSNNSLNSYGCEIKTVDLNSLNLDYNNITTIPSCVLDGTRYAHHVSLRHNFITSVKELQINKSEDKPPPTPKIQYLDLAYNQVNHLKALRKIELLFALDVSNNGLLSIAADTFALHPNVEWLDLSNNLLEHVPDGALASLAMNKHLNLSHNKLHTFDFDQSPLSIKIATLDLRYNRLSYPPFADTGYVAPRLSRISASHNPFRCDCDLRVFLDFLDVLNSTRKQNWFGLGYWDAYEHDPGINQPYVDTEQFTCSQPSHLNGMPLQSLSFRDACPLLRQCPAGCKCELRKGDKEHVSVDCSEGSVTELPADVPHVLNTPLVLYLNRSGLKRLEHRPYLRLVSEIYAERSRLTTVTSGAMEALQNVSVLILHNNQLRSLPAVIQNLTMSAATNISLGKNPWTCGCQDLWMPKWLAKHSGVLYDASNTRCRWTGKMVTKLNSSDLSCGVFNYLPLVITLSLLLVLAIITASLLVKYKLEVLVFLYTRFRVRPFDLYKYDQAQPSQFDIFVSFSQHDHRWVVEKLVDQLENRARPYKLCIHLRDFPVGNPIADSVAWAVDNSRCTLLVLTKDFVASEWCRHEFRAAHARLLKDRDAKLLIVVHGPVDARNLDRELLAYLRTNTYLKTEDNWFWAKLEYALPDPQGNVVVMGEPREGENMDNPPPLAIEMDAIVPVSLAAGDVNPKV